MILPWGDAGKFDLAERRGAAYGRPPVSYFVGGWVRLGSPILYPAGAAYIFVCHISYRILPVHTLAGG